MNIQVCDPLKAKRLFKFRPYKHLAYGVAIFAPVCLVLMLTPLNPWIAMGIAFIPALWFYYRWETRLIVIECQKCGKDINTNTPWECGFKGCRNENADDFPFIYECGICHYVPKAYECHHCGNLIYLTSDRQQLHAAKRLEFPLPSPPPPVLKDPTKEKAARQAEEIQDAKHKLAMTMYEKEAEIIKNKPSAPLPVTPETQKMRERVRKRVESGRDLIKLERELLEEARKECGDNMERFAEEEKNILMEIWRERELRERSAQQDG